jgi:hypothetical protein
MQRRYRACLGVLVGIFIVACSESTIVRRDTPPGARLAPVNLFVTIPRGVTVAQSGPYRYSAITHSRLCLMTRSGGP